MLISFISTVPRLLYIHKSFTEIYYFTVPNFYYHIELRRRKHVVWRPPDVGRRSASRNSEPSHISNTTFAGRPSMPLRSLSLRIPTYERALGVIDPPPPSPIAVMSRAGSSDRDRHPSLDKHILRK